MLHYMGLIMGQASIDINNPDFLPFGWLSLAQFLQMSTRKNMTENLYKIVCKLGKNTWFFILFKCNIFCFNLA